MSGAECGVSDDETKKVHCKSSCKHYFDTVGFEPEDKPKEANNVHDASLNLDKCCTHDLGADLNDLNVGVGGPLGVGPGDTSDAPLMPPGLVPGGGL